MRTLVKWLVIGTGGRGYCGTASGPWRRELEMTSATARERYASFTDHEIDALHAYPGTLAATAPEGES